ncbi:GLPGLI family protein [uncultured Winogradskyella sp.]|uniref:GLPGLI family protein n=1 Tax=uncultured Winogradskyella sp. TaxID=395353 RepID=UPI0030DB46F2|tara:strand:+ start:102945 stop:103808 length:864 start_codon:yes stop_codon:yes gene_type:complete
MATIIRVMVLALTVVFTSVNAQDFQGVATYKTQRKIDIKMDSTKMNSDMQSKMMEMMKKQFQKTYILNFNKEASVYKQEESLAKPQVGGDGFQVMFSGSGGDDALYKNTKEKRYVSQKDAMGKIFLIKDAVETIAWQLESDTKYIGEYQCYKATYVKQVPVMKGFSFSNAKSDNEKEEKEAEEPEMEDRIVTAWYTPQVPVSNGPGMYQGLPGLILEIHDGKLTIVCSKIVLNPEEKVDIEEPSKGKEVNQKEYDDIMEKKSKEMMERYAPKKGDRNGEGFSITIGG